MSLFQSEEISGFFVAIMFLCHPDKGIIWLCKYIICASSHFVIEGSSLVVTIILDETL